MIDMRNPFLTGINDLPVDIVHILLSKLTPSDRRAISEVNVRLRNITLLYIATQTGNSACKERISFFSPSVSRFSLPIVKGKVQDEAKPVVSEEKIQEIKQNLFRATKLQFGDTYGDEIHKSVCLSVMRLCFNDKEIQNISKAIDDYSLKTIERLIDLKEINVRKTGFDQLSAIIACLNTLSDKRYKIKSINWLITLLAPDKRQYFISRTIYEIARSLSMDEEKLGDKEKLDVIGNLQSLATSYRRKMGSQPLIHIIGSISEIARSLSGNEEKLDVIGNLQSLATSYRGVPLSHIISSISKIALRLYNDESILTVIRQLQSLATSYRGEPLIHIISSISKIALRLSDNEAKLIINTWIVNKLKQCDSSVDISVYAYVGEIVCRLPEEKKLSVLRELMVVLQETGISNEAGILTTILEIVCSLPEENKLSAVAELMVVLQEKSTSKIVRLQIILKMHTIAGILSNHEGRLDDIIEQLLLLRQDKDYKIKTKVVDALYIIARQLANEKQKQSIIRSFIEIPVRLLDPPYIRVGPDISIYTNEIICSLSNDKMKQEIITAYNTRLQERPAHNEKSYINGLVEIVCSLTEDSTDKTKLNTIKEIKPFLESREHTMRAFVLKSLTRIACRLSNNNDERKQEVMTLFKPLLQDNKYKVRCAAIESLANIACSLFNDNDENMQGIEKVIAMLKPLLQDNEDKVRSNAIKSMGKIIISKFNAIAKEEFVDENLQTLMYYPQIVSQILASINIEEDPKGNRKKIRDNIRTRYLNFVKSTQLNFRGNDARDFYAALMYALSLTPHSHGTWKDALISLNDENTDSITDYTIIGTWLLTNYQFLLFLYELENAAHRSNLSVSNWLELLEACTLDKWPVSYDVKCNMVAFVLKKVLIPTPAEGWSNTETQQFNKWMHWIAPQMESAIASVDTNALQDLCKKYRWLLNGPLTIMENKDRLALVCRLQQALNNRLNVLPKSSPFFNPEKLEDKITLTRCTFMACLNKNYFSIDSIEVWFKALNITCNATSDPLFLRWYKMNNLAQSPKDIAKDKLLALVNELSKRKLCNLANIEHLQVIVNSIDQSYSDTSLNKIQLDFFNTLQDIFQNGRQFKRPDKHTCPVENEPIAKRPRLG